MNGTHLTPVFFLLTQDQVVSYGLILCVCLSCTLRAHYLGEQVSYVQIIIIIQKESILIFLNNLFYLQMLMFKMENFVRTCVIT